MHRFSYYAILVIVCTCVFACSGNIQLIDKTKTAYGRLAFYRQNLKDTPGVEKLYAAIDTGGNKIFYSFYPERIIKTSENEKQLSYTTIYGQLERPYDASLYQRLSPLDSLVLTRGDSLLNAVGLTNFKKAKGAIAYVIEVAWYHGYPKNMRFRPL